MDMNIRILLKPGTDLRGILQVIQGNEGQKEAVTNTTFLHRKEKL
jgi:hypothetical protein